MNNELPSESATPRQDTSPMDGTANVPTATEATIESVEEFIYNEILLNFGKPAEVLTDRVSSFRNETVKLFMQRLKVRHIFTSPYHPRSNGICERFNGTLNTMLKKYCFSQRNTWDMFIDQCIFTCRIKLHASTGYSPFFLVYGRNPSIPMDIPIPSVIEEGDSTGARLEEVQALEVRRESAKATAQRNQQYMISHYNRTVSEDIIDVGDLVMLRNENPKKYESNWFGPLVVQEKTSYGTFILRTRNGTALPSRIHRDRLKRIPQGTKIKEHLPKSIKKAYLEVGRTVSPSI
jgi:hypothetical protein